MRFSFHAVWVTGNCLFVPVFPGYQMHTSFSTV